MKSYHTVNDRSGRKLHTILWKPDQKSPRGVVQIIHGLAEHSERYSHFAGHLNRQGFVVVAHDHRGHGKTDPDHPGHINHSDGFALMTENIGDIRRWAAEQYPGLPTFMIGHSMGSFLLQRFLQVNDDYPNGIIYSGSNGEPPATLRAGIFLSSLITRLKGDDHPSPLLYGITFGGFNKHFLPVRTKADWISRDPAMVDLYIDDPHCGFICSASFFNHFYIGLRKLHSHKPFADHPQNIPILIFSGDSDPVSDMGKGIPKLETAIRESGVRDLTVKLYPGGRHEMLNELNRNEVYNDVTDWIEKKL